MQTAEQSRQQAIARHLEALADEIAAVRHESAERRMAARQLADYYRAAAQEHRAYAEVVGR